MLQRLRVWANQAHCFTRQRFHRTLDVLLDGVPPLEVLEVQRLDDIPVAVSVLTDVVLDGGDDDDADGQDDLDLGDLLFVTPVERNKCMCM